MGEIEWERMKSGRGGRTETPGEPVWLTGSQVGYPRGNGNQSKDTR